MKCIKRVRQLDRRDKSFTLTCAYDLWIKNKVTSLVLLARFIDFPSNRWNNEEHGNVLAGDILGNLKNRRLRASKFGATYI